MVHASQMTLAKTMRALAFAMVALAILVNSTSAMSMDQLALKEAADELQNRGPSKLASLPSSLTRFLFYSARPSDHQANGGLLGYKRSSSALDTLSGMTIGKRNGPTDYLQLEPFYGRQYGMRSMPRMYDMRWTPFDSYDVAVAPETN